MINIAVAVIAGLLTGLVAFVLGYLLRQSSSNDPEDA